MPTRNDRRRQSAGVEVTVVLATRNRARLLPSVLEALARQRTAAAFEVLVVDNASEDATAQVVDEHARRDPRVRLVVEPVVGLSRAKNRGISCARGNLLLFTDDDVVLPDDWIASYVRFFGRSGEPLLLAGGPVFAIAHDLAPWPRWIGPNAMADLPRLYHGDIPRRMGGFDWVWGANMAARRELFDVIGGFDESVGVAGERRGTYEDVEIVQRVTARGGECWYVPQAVIHHRTPREAARPRALAVKAFSRGANDVLRERRSSHVERSLAVPRASAVAALAAPALLLTWMAAALALRATRGRRSFELVRRAAWASGWCIATTSERFPDARTWRRLALTGRTLAVRLTPG